MAKQKSGPKKEPKSARARGGELAYVLRHVEEDPDAPSRLLKHPYLRRQARKAFGNIQSYSMPREVHIDLKVKKPRTIRVAVEQAVRDMNIFYTALDLVRGYSDISSREEKMDAYRRMERIAKTYGNPTLQNKLDEAEAHLRTGR